MTPIHNPLITVIIAVWNGRATIGRCLDAVRAHSLPPEELEIIVVDNGATKGRAGLARSVPGVIVATAHAPGSYQARNGRVGLGRGSLGRWRCRKGERRSGRIRREA